MAALTGEKRGLMDMKDGNETYALGGGQTGGGEGGRPASQGRGLHWTILKEWPLGSNAVIQ